MKDDILKNENMEQVDPAKLAEILDAAVGSEVSKLQTFVDLAQNLRAKQNELDIMAADTLPAAILTAYVSDILEPNNNGDLISIIGQNPGEQTILNSIYHQLNIPEEKVVYSLLKNAVAIAEFSREKVKPKETSATEDIKVQVNYGRVLPEINMLQDTTRVFPIIQKERCVGFIEVTSPDRLDNFNWTTDMLDYDDVVIHSKSDYVYVKYGINKYSKPLQLRIKNKDGQLDVYDIDIGHSLLENSYSAWKTLSILQDSIVLASLIKNASTIIIQTEAGEMSEAQIEAAKIKLKSLFEGKLSLGNDGLKSYLAPSAKPNYVYSFTYNGTGAITSDTIGGEYDPGQLYYLTPFINQFFAGMGAPKQAFNFTGESAGLDGGGAVEEYTKRYLSNVSLFKRLLAKFIKDCINNVLSSRGLLNIVNNFEVVIYKAYKEEDLSIIQMQQQTMQTMQELLQFLDIEDPDKIKKLKMAMFRKTFSDKALISAVEEALTEDEEPEEEPTSEPDETEKGSDDLGNQIVGELEDGTEEDLPSPNETVEIPEEEELPELPPMTGNLAEEE